ncbi:MAG: aldolase/citrate lyase family protein [Parasphingorhabdus sp.]|nr:aldolase/citrate lyase family protein [Parasphingorhabdus sp.]
MVSLKHRIAAGDALLGTFVKTPHPHIVEVLATSGLDCVVIDAEHAPFDRRDIDICVMAAQLGGLPVLVRTPSNVPEQILNALDCGADGVLVPHVRSAAEARAIAASAHYQPGGRGYAGSSRAAGYGTVPMPGHKAASAAKTVVIAQIEDAEALDEIDAIAAVDGIDALFVGRIDLTVSLGCESPDDPKVVAAVDHIVAACVSAKRPVGMFLSRTSDVAMWRDRGATIFLMGSDHGFMREGAGTLRAATGL